MTTILIALPLKALPTASGNVVITTADDCDLAICEPADAAYIIRAVNSFEKLREALRPFACDCVPVSYSPCRSGHAFSAKDCPNYRAAAVLKEF